MPSTSIRTYTIVLTVSIAIGLFLFLPMNVYAGEGLVTCNGPECDFCDLVELFNRIIQWLTIISILIIVMMISYAGFKLVTSRGDQSAYEKGKEYLVNSIIGLIIILAAFTIVDTLLKALIRDEANIGKILSPAECPVVAPNVAEGAGDAVGTVAADTSAAEGAGDAVGTVAADTSVAEGAGDAVGTVAADTSAAEGAGDAVGTVAADTSAAEGAGEALRSIRDRLTAPSAATPTEEERGFFGRIVDGITGLFGGGSDSDAPTTAPSPAPAPPATGTEETPSTGGQTANPDISEIAPPPPPPPGMG